MRAKWHNHYKNDDAYRAENNARLNLAQREYWADAEHRQQQAAKVREHFSANPEARTWLAEQAREQWTDKELLAWRSAKTSEQWTEAFREKRRTALAQTYFRKTVATLRSFVSESGAVELQAYDAHRIALRDKSLLRFGTAFLRALLRRRCGARTRGNRAAQSQGGSRRAAE